MLNLLELSCPLRSILPLFLPHGFYGHLISRVKTPSHPGVHVLTCSLHLKIRVFCRSNLHSPFMILRMQPGSNGRGRKMCMLIFFHVFSMSDITYYRTYLSERQTCSMPMVHTSFQTQKRRKYRSCRKHVCGCD